MQKRSSAVSFAHHGEIRYNHGMTASSHRSASGFSLVELLVVISVLALLLALLSPAIALVRDQARSTRCAASLRQLGLAFGGYANDHEGVVIPTSRFTWNTSFSFGEYPYGVLWHVFAQPYLERSTERAADNLKAGVVWGCPVWRGRVDGSGIINGGWTGYGRNFVLRGPTDVHLDSELTASEWGWPGGYVEFDLANIATPSSRILAGDSIDWHLFPDPNGAPGTWPAWSGDPQRHRGRANYLFCDLHVATADPRGGWDGVYPP